MLGTNIGKTEQRPPLSCSVKAVEPVQLPPSARAATGANNATFCAIYTLNASFYQDRLGTNMGKTQNRVAFFLGAGAPQPMLVPHPLGPSKPPVASTQSRKRPRPRPADNAAATDSLILQLSESEHAALKARDQCEKNPFCKRGAENALF
jgi:hypothetical protein